MLVTYPMTTKFGTRFANPVVSFSKALHLIQSRWHHAFWRPKLSSQSDWQTKLNYTTPENKKSRHPYHQRPKLNKLPPVVENSSTNLAESLWAPVFNSPKYAILSFNTTNIQKPKVGHENVSRPLEESIDLQIKPMEKRTKGWERDHPWCNRQL